MSVLIHPVNDLASLLDLERVKPDAFLAAGPNLGWGRIYGGQVVAQALRAAGLTVDAPHQVHSLHAYFVRARATNANRCSTKWSACATVGRSPRARWSRTRPAARSST